MQVYGNLQRSIKQGASNYLLRRLAEDVGAPELYRRFGSSKSVAFESD